MLSPPLDARSYNPKEPDRQQELRRSPDSAERMRASSLSGRCFASVVLVLVSRVGPLVSLFRMFFQSSRSKQRAYEREPQRGKAGRGEHPKQHRVTHWLVLYIVRRERAHMQPTDTMRNQLQAPMRLQLISTCRGNLRAGLDANMYSVQHAPPRAIHPPAE